MCWTKWVKSVTLSSLIHFCQKGLCPSHTSADWICTWYFSSHTTAHHFPIQGVVSSDWPGRDTEIVTVVSPRMLRGKMTRNRRSTSGIAIYCRHWSLETCQTSGRLHLLSRSLNTWISVTTELHCSPHTGWTAAATEASHVKSHFLMFCPARWHPLSTTAKVRNTHTHHFSSFFFFFPHATVVWSMLWSKH